MPDVQDIRQQIDSALATEQWPHAFHLLGDLWRAQPTAATAAFITTRAERLRDHWPMIRYRLALLRSFTLEPLLPMLRAAAFVSGIDLTLHLGDFNTYAQEILDPQSKLYVFKPDAVILAVQTRDLAPELWTWSQDHTDGEVISERINHTFANLITALRQQNDAHLVIHNLEQPAFASDGLLDAQAPRGQAATVQQINARLRQIVAQQRGVYLLDYDNLAARYGRMRWTDERKWLMARAPVTADAMPLLVDEWLRFLHPLSGRVCKALAVDLDNTLWGGVVGEDGSDGIKLGDEYPGAAFTAVQQAALDLRARGVLLTICSKNNPTDALAVLESHPQMLLRPQHFAAQRINWQDKARNLRELADELNLGLDAIAFLDDNPVERALVRAALPEVTVIDLPDDPMRYAATLRAQPVFERLTISAEDGERSRHYAEQRQRAALQQATTSLEEFYRSLAQEVEVLPASPATIARIAQLTQKTNQFNLTTRRYSEQQIAALAQDVRHRVYAARVRDRFGDHGLVGVAIIAQQPRSWLIDTFLLSCRVIGRTVETACLAFLIEQARAAGIDMLRGEFIATHKNAPAKEFFAAHGFTRVGGDEARTTWELPVSTAKLPCPEWIILKGTTASAATLV